MSQNTSVVQPSAWVDPSPVLRVRPAGDPCNTLAGPFVGGNPMTDTVVRAGGSKSWEVRIASTGKLVGHITPTVLMTECQIHHIVEEVLDKLKAGPYSSKQEAMNAIAGYTNGT